MPLIPSNLLGFRLTIERLRTLVLVAAALLIVALAVSLTISHWKSRFNISEIPKRLGVNIEQESNGVTYTQARGGHTSIKIHASKVVQLKEGGPEGGKALLHDVQIDLYGEDGSSVDHIAGKEFEYDAQAGLATAAGPVEITMTKPGSKLAVDPKAATAPESAKGTPLGNATQSAESGQIEVKTSGLTFNQKTGVATTQQHVEFVLAQGEGSSTGATFDSDKGLMVLDSAVVLNVQRGPQTVQIHAQHAEFDRNTLLCNMRSAEANYREAHATSGAAKILFRKDGSAVRLDATSGFALATATGGHVAAPQGWIEFNEKNQPTRGHLEGGVTMDSITGGRQAHGSSPQAELEFAPTGEIRHMHLERGVQMASEEDTAGAHISRTWHSPVADVSFKPNAKGQAELDTIQGQGGAVITGQTRRGDGSMSPSRMSADTVTAAFAAGQQVKQVVGTGHASMEQTAANGTVQTTTGDKLVANLYPSKQGAQGHAGATPQANEVESATVDGNVVLVQQPTHKPGQAAEPPLRATGQHAVYDGVGQWLHLTGNPRVINGGMELTADKVDVSQQAGNAESTKTGPGNSNGDAFAHGNVKATWVNDGRGSNASGPNASGSKSSGTVGLGGQTPAHVIAQEAEFHQSTGEAIFKGNARLWQDANSVAAPVIVLNRGKHTLAAHAGGVNNPVKLVLLSASNTPDGKPAAKTSAAQKQPASPSVIRVRGGDLLYSDATRKAVLNAAPLNRVTAETGTETSNSDTVELLLLPAGSPAANKNQLGAPQPGASQVDRMTARGHVVLRSPGAQGDRQGTGEQLVYTGSTGQYVLTGTDAVPPKMNDPASGTVTGKALIFNSRDDSVSIEGGSGQTTVAPRAPGR